MIRAGASRRYGTPVRSYRHPEGRQGIVRRGTDGAGILAVVHRFGAGRSDGIEVPTIPEAERYEITDVLTDGQGTSGAGRTNSAVD